MAKVFTHNDGVLGTTDTDIYTANAKALNLLIQAVNATGSVVQMELWITDNSNVRKACIVPWQDIEGYDGVSDSAKHVLPIGYKVRGKASAGATIYVEVNTMEGMA